MANLIEMPKLGFDMAEGTLVNWVKKEGDQITKGDILAEIETDKATVQVESSFSGIVLKELVSVDSTVPIGTPIAVIGEEGEELDLEGLVGEPPAVQEQTPQIEEDPIAPTPAIQETRTDGFIKASPLAKAIAKEKSVDLTQIRGSGPDGRIVKLDVENFLKEGAAVTEVPTAQPTAIVSGTDRQLPLSNLRKTIGIRMQASKQQIPHFYITHEYDVEILMKMRKEINQDRTKEERISVNDFIVKAAAMALNQFPALNSSLSKGQIMQHGNINIGNAVSVENGLLTVVCKNADQKDLVSISHEIRAMVSRVRSGKVSPTDIEGSTFTISNLGMFEVESFNAIINPPEAAILAVASAAEVPVVVDGVIKPGMRMKMTLAADHRITDGAEAARFMQEIATYLEQPWKLWK